MWDPFADIQKCRQFQTNEMESTPWPQIQFKGVESGDVNKSSGLVPFEEPACLAHDMNDVLHLCHYLHSFGIRFDKSLSASKLEVVSDMPVVPSKDIIDKESESEDWKHRFESLDKFREQLKNASIESESINEIIESMESDDVGEWINFAAASAGAKIVGSNPETRNPLRVIDGKKDTFMKNDCKVDQWLIIELSHAAKVKMIELTMKELYSPRVAKIKVYSRMASMSKNVTEYPDRFQNSKWHSLTEIKPENRKGTQHFTVISRGLVKYLGIHIKEYHGVGTTCTINDISVFGLAPVDNLESLLEEAVHDEVEIEEPAGESADQQSSHLEPNKPQVVQFNNENNQEHTSDEALPSLGSILELDNQTESQITEQEEKQRTSDEEGSRKTSKNGEGVSSVSTFRKMHQDVQALKGSTAVLSQYVDELHGGLMQTIDELWKAQKNTKTDTDVATERIRDMQMSIQRLERVLDAVQTEQRSSIRKSQVTMGIMGFCVSFIGLLSLRLSTISKQSHLFIFAVYLLCCLNFIVSFLNIAAVLSPAILIRVSRLKTKFRPHWRPVITG